MGRLLFFIVNSHFHQGETLAKPNVKQANFSSIGCANVGAFTMSFGYETAQNSIKPIEEKMIGFT